MIPHETAVFNRFLKVDHVCYRFYSWLMSDVAKNIKDIFLPGGLLERTLKDFE